MKKIDNIKISDLLPDYLNGDIKLKALSQGIEDVLAEWLGSVEDTLIYKNINDLPEAMIILLLDEWHVDFVDDKTTFNQKKELLKKSFDSHTRKGTVDVLEKTIKNIFGNVDILEWFDYAGDPGKFKLIVEGSPPTTEEVERIYKALNEYKNTRSHLDGFIISTVSIENTKYNGKLNSSGRNIYR